MTKPENRMSPVTIWNPHTGKQKRITSSVTYDKLVCNGEWEWLHD